ncbi:hypothetical protein VNO77_03858 [Canavalia gladiata]|uniref:Uncharacterized protein n=1 Tax=Canavalia gladiata TaxID=3824 RepID=A0AAN9R4A9_CANGL
MALFPSIESRSLLPLVSLESLFLFDHHKLWSKNVFDACNGGTQSTSRTPPQADMTIRRCKQNHSSRSFWFNNYSDKINKHMETSMDLPGGFSEVRYGDAFLVPPKREKMQDNF